MSAEPCRNLVTIAFTCTGRPTTPTTPGLVVSGQHRPSRPSARIKHVVRQPTAPRAPRRGQPALLTTLPVLLLRQHSMSPGGDITTCCCSEYLVLGRDWVGQPMLARCASATRGRPSPSMPCNAVTASGWLGKSRRDSDRLSHEAPQSISARRARALFRGPSTSDMGCIRPLPNFHPTV